VTELQTFIFEGMPVRGAIVRLTDGWQEVLARRAGNPEQGPYPEPVLQMLGEMTAAAVLLQTNIKFNGALILQVFGDGPVKLAVAEVHSDLRFRATCSVQGAVQAHSAWSDLVHAHGQGRCAITLDPQDRLPGQQPYQGVVPLVDAQGQVPGSIAEVVEHYMRQSEQLDTVLVLAADAQVASGLLIQRLPIVGQANLQGQTLSDEALQAQADEDFSRIAMLTRSLKREELLSLDVATVLHRLYWQEPLAALPQAEGKSSPSFSCSCSRERVGRMIVGLGREEAESILLEQGQIDVSCDFCGQRYLFDAVDAAGLFTADEASTVAASATPTVH
jgi:molecular chaperone Hsp33